MSEPNEVISVTLAGRTFREEWRPLSGFEGTHEVSSEGRIRSLPRVIETRLGPRRYQGRLMATTFGPYEQATVALRGTATCVRIHVAVAAAFLGERPDGTEVCHNDGDLTNNRASNLRYDTHGGNVRDTVRHGRHHYAGRTHCGNGHEFTPENTLPRPDGGRRCRACRVAQNAARAVA